MGALAGVFGFLRAIPWWVYPVAIVLAWGWSGNHRARVNAEAAAHAKQEAAAANQTAEQEKGARNETDRIVDKRSSIAEADAAQAAKDRAAAAAVNARTVGLLKRIDELVTAGRAGQAASAVPGGSPADQLGSTLKACVDEYRSLGELAVDAVRRGERCAAEYEALTKP